MGRKPSSSGITITEIAKEAGVSLATVSRVFNGSDLVRPEVEEKILKIAQGHNFVPRQAHKRDTVVLVIEDCPGPSFSNYVSSVISALVRKCAQRRVRLDIVTVEQLHLIRPRYVKGIFSLLWENDSLETFSKLKQARLVAINTDQIPQHVCSDERQGMQLVIDHFMALGHTSIALITRSFESYGDRERRLAFQQFDANGTYKGLKKIFLEFDGTADSLFEVLKKTFESKRDRPTAIFATSEETGVMIPSCLRQLGKRSPQDVSFISHEVYGVSTYLVPAQTTLAVDYYGIVDRAFDMLESKGSEQFVPYQLIERQSVCALNDSAI